MVVTDDLARAVKAYRPLWLVNCKLGVVWAAAKSLRTQEYYLLAVSKPKSERALSAEAFADIVHLRTPVFIGIQRLLIHEWAWWEFMPNVHDEKEWLGDEIEEFFGPIAERFLREG